MAQLTSLVEAGRPRVSVGAVFPLEAATAAHKIGETGRTQGKIVLSVTS